MSTNEKARVITAVGRLCFDRTLFEANEKGKFGCAMVIPNGTDLNNVLKICQDAANEKWSKGLPPNLKMPVKQQDPTKFEKYPYLENNMLLQGNSGFAIPVINQKGGLPLDREGIKGGDYVQFSVSAFTYDMEGNKGVGLNINAVMKTDNGEAFFVKQNASDFFGGLVTQSETSQEFFPETNTTTEDTSATNLDINNMSF